MKNEPETSRERMLAEITNLQRLREGVVDGSEWARWIDQRLVWLTRKLQEGTDVRKT